TCGDLFALLRDTVWQAGDCGGRPPYRELPAYLFTPGGAPTPAQRVLDSFVTLRNRAWGHGAWRDEAVHARLLPANRARPGGELPRLARRADGELVRPVAISEAGQVLQADLLMGERRLKGRRYELALAPADLDHEGGGVRPEKSLLLVAPGRRDYLPLF